jgi:hypothetical protein
VLCLSLSFKALRVESFISFYIRSTSNISSAILRMRSSIWIASALSTVALAAPSWDVKAEDVPVVSEYFQLLGSKIQEQRSLSAVPVCDLSKAVMPSGKYIV